MTLPRIATRDEWLAARTALLEKEKALTLVSRAPLARIEPFRARMGWTVPWVSFQGSDITYDFHVTLDDAVAPAEYNYRSRAELVRDGLPVRMDGIELPGISVFVRDGDAVHHTYSTYARGHDALLGTDNWLDLTPFGRGEGWDGMPDLGGKGMRWLRYHDAYES